MLDLGPILFTAPWILTALAVLPILWWLLRITPPAPQILAFPPLRFLLALQPQEETPARTPLWLILLRMLIAALIILALAHPLWNPGERLHGSGPLVLVVDDGWAAGPGWRKRLLAMEALVDQAERDGRPVRIMTTARANPTDPLQISELIRPSEARQRLRGMRPKPWPNDRAGAIDALQGLDLEGSAHVAWLSDGINGPDAARLMERLQQLGALRVYRETGTALARLVVTPRSTQDGLAAPVLRSDPRGEVKLLMRLIDDDGRLLGQQEGIFADGEPKTEIRFKMPPNIRNRAARIEIEGESGAGAVFLMDERWRRRPVGVASGGLTEGSQPLLSEDYYLTRALEPFSDVRTAKVNELIEEQLSIIVLADIGKLAPSEVERLGSWIREGGVLLRFAGPRMAQGTDALVPVKLRGGRRALGGAMSWSQPARLLPFEETSPFAGLAIPPEVRISRQVLAEPSLDLNTRTWLRLSDGTPLVTAEHRGNGWLVLVHTTANTEWSNLPLSGLFVEMLQRISNLGQGVAGDDGKAVFPPLQTLDGFGVLGPALGSAVAISGKDFLKAKPGPNTPPGYYGRGDTRRALNIASGVERLAPLEGAPSGVKLVDYTVEAGFDAKPWLLLAALLLLLADLIISYVLRGLGPRRATATVASIMVLTAGMLTLSAPDTARAQTIQAAKPQNTEEAFALKATLETRLAYILTGDAQLDAASHGGLKGLSTLLRQRTAVEPGDPIGVNIDRDELSLFPVLYWPVSISQRPLSNKAVEKLNAYLRGGGTVLFDTREQSQISFDPFGVGGPESAKLRDMLGSLDIPTLIPVPKDHVVNKSFYLLKGYPGRWTGGTVWVERRGGRHNDGVSSVIIGSHDWAGAWAVDRSGAAMFPMSSGGERQREMAYRFGVNWVMYALTGNYKTDQVHIPAIIERLGQ
jgi:hypothetical protein